VADETTLDYLTLLFIVIVDGKALSNRPKLQVKVKFGQLFRI